MLINAVFQFKITLDDAQRNICRRIQVTANSTFSELQLAIDWAMGLTGVHLYQFWVRNPYTTQLEIIVSPGLMNREVFRIPNYEIFGADINLSQYFSSENKVAQYNYDIFSCGWMYTITLETSMPKNQNQKYPFCLEGNCTCSSEYTGSLYGFAEHLLNTINNGNEDDSDFIDCFAVYF